MEKFICKLQLHGLSCCNPLSCCVDCPVNIVDSSGINPYFCSCEIRYIVERSYNAQRYMSRLVSSLKSFAYGRSENKNL